MNHFVASLYVLGWFCTEELLNFHSIQNPGIRGSRGNSKWIPLHHICPYRASKSGAGSQGWESEKQNFHFTCSFLLFEKSLDEDPFTSQ